VHALEETAKGFTEPFLRLWEGLRMDDQFASGLCNIRDAIETRLKDSGVQKVSLGDSCRECPCATPSMVMFDVSGNGNLARVTFTRDEVEDCCVSVGAYCVRLKINHLVDELLLRPNVRAWQ
jgi:hypothetical protein